MAGGTPHSLPAELRPGNESLERESGLLAPDPPKTSDSRTENHPPPAKKTKMEAVPERGVVTLLGPQSRLGDSLLRF